MLTNPTSLLMPYPCPLPCLPNVLLDLLLTLVVIHPTVVHPTVVAVSVVVPPPQHRSRLHAAHRQM